MAELFAGSIVSTTPPLAATALAPVNVAPVAAAADVEPATAAEEAVADVVGACVVDEAALTGLIAAAVVVVSALTASAALDVAALAGTLLLVLLLVLATGALPQAANSANRLMLLMPKNARLVFRLMVCNERSSPARYTQRGRQR